MRAAQEREERLAALAEVDPAVPGATPERRLIRLHATGPRAPTDAVLPPICMYSLPCLPKVGSLERERILGAGPGNPGTIPERERSLGVTQGREERLTALTEADLALPDTAPERRLVSYMLQVQEHQEMPCFLPSACPAWAVCAFLAWQACRQEEAQCLLALLDLWCVAL